MMDAWDRWTRGALGVGIGTTASCTPTRTPATSGSSTATGSASATRPLAMPTASSRRKVRIALAEFSSRVASARTVTVSAWVPALPPRAETMGISTAKATIC